MDQPRRTLTIAVLTYRRPDDLVAVLPELAAQAAEVADRVDARVLVVDNDPDGGARETVAALATGAAAPVHYAHEPEPGISAGRNRALDESADADLLVFIDDDERPREHWLALLLDTLDREGTTAVVGPVVSEYAAPLTPWVEAGRFFDRRRLPTGTRVTVAATNNLLLDLAVVRRLGLRFDPRFGLTGGGDTMFTRELIARGGSMVWCDEAVVTDVVPVQRLSREWVLQRTVRSGNSWSVTSLALQPDAGGRARTRVVLTGKGAVRVAGGAARLVLGVLSRRMDQRARGLRTMARGAGMVSGAWGHRHVEYRRA